MRLQEYQDGDGKNDGDEGRCGQCFLALAASTMSGGFPVTDELAMIRA